MKMKKVENDRWYSVNEIADEGLIPVLDTPFKVKQWIDRGLLKGNTVGQGNGRRYFIKGSAIIQFLAKWESGDFHR